MSTDNNSRSSSQTREQLDFVHKVVLTLLALVSISVSLHTCHKQNIPDTDVHVSCSRGQGPEVGQGTAPLTIRVTNRGKEVRVLSWEFSLADTDPNVQAREFALAENLRTIGEPVSASHDLRLITVTYDQIIDAAKGSRSACLPLIDGIVVHYSGGRTSRFLCSQAKEFGRDVNEAKDRTPNK